MQATPELRRSICVDGLLYSTESSGDRVEVGVAEPLLAQWYDDGFAVRRESGWLVSWTGLYEALQVERDANALASAGIPNRAAIAPRLKSRGALSDRDFEISVAGWVDDSGKTVDDVRLVGATAEVNGRTGLLPREVWRLLERIRMFASRSNGDRSPNAQRLSWGEIRRLAEQAEARLDDFLFRTVVLSPDKLRIDLRKGAGGRGFSLVEVIPGFERSPESWLSAFDRFSQVQDRYDLTTPNGVVQILVSGDVRFVLEQIKRMPGRRIAGARAEAFLANPFATLGDPARSVIGEAQFERARTDAGLVLDHFTAFVEVDGYRYPKCIGLLVDTTTDAGRVQLRYQFRSEEDIEQFVAKIRASISRGDQVFPWEEFDLELLGDVETHLQVLVDALELKRTPVEAILNVASVYDLSTYSERISGIGEETPYASPFIARRSEGEGWFPENLVMTIAIPATTPDGTPRYIAFPASEVAEINDQISEALKSGQPFVTIPGISEPMATLEAHSVFRHLRQAWEDAHSGTLDPDQQDAEGRRPRRSLLLKPNIASLDYLELRREVLSAPADSPVIPSGVKAGTQFKQHQLKGIAWLQHLVEQGPAHCRGAVLADDMGLGKTLQLLTLIKWARVKSPRLPPALVVAPVSLLDEWRLEVGKFFDTEALSILEVHGDRLSELRLPQESIEAELRATGLTKFLRPGWVGTADIVLTTYETLRDHEFSFAAERWSILVCDEAQKIKNPNALVTRAAKKQNARFRIACTGTPVENTLADLWCLFDFVQPGLLGSLNEFGTKYRRPIEAKTDSERERVEELREMIRPQILRRMKVDVAHDLPLKHFDAACKQLQLSDQQRALYGQALAQYGRRNESGAAVPFKNALGLLHYLRLVCTDPQPLGLGAAISQPTGVHRANAPKLDWILRTLCGIRDREEKAIVFCEFRDIQRMLRHRIASEFGITPEIVNGDTTTATGAVGNRRARIKAFQDRPGFGVIILSPLAVGFGVNIQAANHVIHYSRTWNPAKEDQATDRAYRIGQSKDVYVYCPVVCASDFKTFDVKLDELLERKRGLAGDMLNGSPQVDWKEFDLADVAPSGTSLGAPQLIGADELDRLKPSYFEALIAALWERRGYSPVIMTPPSGDGGVDVVALRGTEGELIQCKTSSRQGAQLGWDAIKEVVAGEAAYRVGYPGVEFRRVCVANQGFTPSAKEQALLNGVELIDRKALLALLAVDELTLQDVEAVHWSERPDFERGQGPPSA